LDVSRRRLEAAGRLLAAAAGLPRLPDAPVEGTLAAAVPDYDWPATLAVVLSQSSEVQEAQALHLQAEETLRLAIARRKPNVQVQVGPFYSAPDHNSQLLAQVATSLPLYDRNQGNIISARADVSRTAAGVRQVELRLTERLAAVFQRYQAAREQRQAYERRVLPEATESLRLITVGYAKGDPKYDFTAVLQAQQTLAQTQLAYVQVLGELWRAVSDIRGLLQQDIPGPFAAPCPDDEHAAGPAPPPRGVP